MLLTAVRRLFGVERGLLRFKLARVAGGGSAKFSVRLGAEGDLFFPFTITSSFE